MSYLRGLVRRAHGTPSPVVPVAAALAGSAMAPDAATAFLAAMADADRAACVAPDGREASRSALAADDVAPEAGWLGPAIRPAILPKPGAMAAVRAFAEPVTAPSLPLADAGRGLPAALVPQAGPPRPVAQGDVPNWRARERAEPVSRPAADGPADIAPRPLLEGRMAAVVAAPPPGRPRGAVRTVPLPPAADAAAAQSGRGQDVVISIGRIELRAQLPAPHAAPPRAAPFRPRLTLEEHLAGRRGRQ